MDAILKYTAAEINALLDQIKAGGLTPSGDPMHYAYEAAGAVWNGTMWELNGGEFDNDTIRLAYWRGNQRIYPTANLIQLLSYPLVANFPASNIPLNTADKAVNIGDIATNNMFLENVRLTTNEYDVYTSSLNYSFYGCQKLRIIANVINVSIAEWVDDNSFYACNRLEELRLKGVHTTISLQYSPLKVECATYLLNNASSSEEFTVTFKASMQPTYEANADFIAARDAKTNITIMYN